METFRNVTEIQAINRRSFPLADPSLLRPQTSANPIIMGEWFGLNASYQMARGSGAQSVPTFPYWAESGRYEVQAIEKGPFLFLGSFEADSKVFDGTAITAVGQMLYVDDVTIGSLTKQGLVGIASPTTEVAIGFVTRLPASNNGWLRFVRNLT